MLCFDVEEDEAAVCCNWRNSILSVMRELRMRWGCGWARIARVGAARCDCGYWMDDSGIGRVYCGVGAAQVKMERRRGHRSTGYQLCMSFILLVVLVDAEQS